MRDAVRSLNGAEHACVCNDQHQSSTAGMLVKRSLDPLPKRLPRLAFAREVTEFSATPRIELARMEFFDLVRRETGPDAVALAKTSISRRCFDPQLLGDDRRCLGSAAQIAAHDDLEGKGLQPTPELAGLTSALLAQRWIRLTSPAVDRVPR